MINWLLLLLAKGCLMTSIGFSAMACKFNNATKALIGVVEERQVVERFGLK